MTPYTTKHELTLHLLPGIPACMSNARVKEVLKRFKPVHEPTTPFLPLWNNEPVEISIGKWLSPGKRERSYTVLNTFGN